VTLYWLDGDGFNPWPVLALVGTTASQAEGAAAMLAATGLGSVLMRPSWPGDDEALTVARRDPINDGENTPGTFVWLDSLDRPAYTVARSFASWTQRLTEEALADPRVRGLIDWLGR
jgi:hypothetical protein